MTTSTTERQRANDFYSQFKNSNRLTISEITKNLTEVNNNIKRELNYSKDLRKVEDLRNNLATRHFYKTVLTLISK